MRGTNWLLYVGASVLSAWIVCWTGVFVYSLGLSAGHGYQALPEVVKSIFAGTDLVIFTFLMYVPLWVSIIFVWMGALWHEEPSAPKQYCKYCAAELGVDALSCEQCGKKVT